MSILSKWLFKKFQSELKTKGFQSTDPRYNEQIYPDFGRVIGGNVIWNPENDDQFISKGYQGNVTVYSIIQLIIKHASSVPFNIYQVKDQQALKAYKQMTGGLMTPDSIINSRILKAKTLIDTDGTDLEVLLNRPNPAQSYASWISELIAFGRLTGDRYIYKIGADTGKNAGRAKELYVLPSQSVEIVSGGIFEPVQGYVLDFNAQQMKMPVDDVCHIKDFNPDYDGTGANLYGQSPLKAAFRNLETNNEAINTGMNYLQNQMTRGLLTVDEGDMNEVQGKALKDNLKADFEANQGGVTISPRKMTWTNFGLNAADTAVIEQYNVTIKDLCNAYNVPVTLLNNTDASTESNVKENRKALYQNAIIPELTKIRDEINRFLVPSFGNDLYFDFDYSSIPELQVDLEKMATTLQNSNWLTQNEKRIAMNYAIDEDNDIMNDYLIPQGLTPLSDLDMSDIE